MMMSKRRCVSVSTLNFAAAALHCVQAIVAFALVAWLEAKPRSAGTLFDGGHFTLVRMVWHETTSVVNKTATTTTTTSLESVVVESGSINALYVIVAFFALSAVFQCAGGLLSDTAAMARLRFIEYSFSASIMMLVIALESGIRDLYTLQCMFVLTWATQMFGLLADTISDYSSSSLQQPQAEAWLWLLPHVAGWATCMSAYGPAIDMFFQSVSHSERRPPSFVTALIFAELVMFSCFGLVQTYGLTYKTLLSLGYLSYYTEEAEAAEDDDDELQHGYFVSNSTSVDLQRRRPTKSLDDRIHEVNTTCEYAFIMLSLVAKTLLGWIVLSPLITSR